MVTAATLTPGAGTAGGTRQTTDGRQAGQAAVAVTPFIRASQEHRESAGIDVSRALTTATQDLGAFPIPAYGYLRSLLLYVTATGGAGTSVTLNEDGPFNVLQNVIVQEPNGATIVQFNSGYDCYLANKYGGYRYCNDPRRGPAYTVAVGSNMNFTFIMRIPLEIDNRDALGSLPNQNAAATFVLRMTLAAVGTVFGGTLTTPPTVRIRVLAEEWDQPETASDGAPNQTTPPAMNTTQYWSVQQFPVNAGNLNIRLTRMGNYLRNLIFVYRATSDGTRGTADTQWPDPATLYWDTRPLDASIYRQQWQHTIYERYGYSNVAQGGGALASNTADSLDPGVFPYDFCHEFKGQVGFENRDLWLPTLGSTRLEIGGQWGVAGTLYVLTNDVSVAGNVWL